jgi:hypothetical protein
MKIYFSARHARIPELQEYAQELEALGHIVVSRWVQDPDKSFSRNSLHDLTTADAVISFTEEPGVQTLGGRHVELGVAIATDKTVFVIGPIENQFYRLAGSSQFDSFEKFVGWLKAHTARYGLNELAVRSVIDFARGMDLDTINILCRELLAGPAAKSQPRIYFTDIDDGCEDNIWHDAVNAFRKNANAHGFFGDIISKGAICLASAALAEAHREMLTDDDYMSYTALYRQLAQPEESLFEAALG